MRVGIYTNMRPDCTAGPLPAIRLSIAAGHGGVTVRRKQIQRFHVNISPGASDQRI